MRRVREFLGGAGLLWRGLRTVASSPRLFLLGLTPGAVVGALIVVGLAFVVRYVEPTGRIMAGWIVSESNGWYEALSIAFSFVVLAGSVAVVMMTFTTLTLFVGQPFFEAISRHVDVRLGLGITEESRPWWADARRAVVDGARAVALSIVLSLAMFALGFIPLVGPVSAFVIGAFLGGRLVTMELSGYPLSRSDVLTWRERSTVLKALGPRAWGFGAMVFAAFTVPLGAVIMMPAASAGATLLVRGPMLAERRTVAAPASAPEEVEAPGDSLRQEHAEP